MNLFIFGSTGDLVKRKVMKALQELDMKELKIHAVGRKELDREEYQDFICDDWCKINFRKSINYVQVDFSNLGLKDFENYLDKEEENYFYVSLPPSKQKELILFFGKVCNDGYKIKILLEKPFGENLNSAIELKNLIESSNLGKCIFISDHYLFKKNFINLPENFGNLKIVSLETVGLENRISYYDDVGAMKDMIQSHFLNLVIRNLDYKINVDKLEIEEVLRGQYFGYIDELGKESDTETFVKIKFSCCDKKFEFVTGKAFDKKECFIELDRKKFFMGDENSYMEIFKSFFYGKMESFPSIEDSMLAWKIVEKFEDFGKNKELFIYKKGSEYRDF